jgi:phosphatidylethanolamine-binding protein (PEBP) family uncharacterized protein
MTGVLNSRSRVVSGRRTVLLLAILMVFSTSIAACAGNTPSLQGETETTLSLSSTAFKEADKIPARYACDGQDMSPPLAWDEPPQGTRAFAMIVEDPDAPGGAFIHWILRK